MSIKRTRAGWYMLTDGEGIFHPVEVQAGQQLVSGQPYILSGATEEELMAKCFDSPKREADAAGDMIFELERLNKRSKTEIIANKDDDEIIRDR